MESCEHGSSAIRIHEASFNKTKESVTKIKTRKMRPLAQMLRVIKETAVSLFKVTDKEKQTNKRESKRQESFSSLTDYNKVSVLRSQSEEPFMFPYY